MGNPTPARAFRHHGLTGLGACVNGCEFEQAGVGGGETWRHGTSTPCPAPAPAENKEWPAQGVPIS